MRRFVVLALALLLWPLVGPERPALAHSTTQNERLPTIGPAPDFSLTSQDGASVSLGDYRGKVVAVTFIYASCTDTCPLLMLWTALIQPASLLEVGGQEESHGSSGHDRIGSGEVGLSSPWS